jgi:hypothetical protein
MQTSRPTSRIGFGRGKEVSPTRKNTDPPEDQVARFKDVARALGCDEDKEKFEAALGAIVQYKPPPKPKKMPKAKKTKPAQ